LKESYKIFNLSFYILFFLILIGCKKNSLERNPFLPEFNFQYSVNLNLPEYENIQYAGGSILISNIGYKGVIVFNLNGNTFFAWEASCPNHSPSSCSKMKIEGVLSVCNCENYKYSLATGQLISDSIENKKTYPLLNYSVENFANNLIISN